MAKDYYTVAEFADMAGISKQAIYKRIEKDLAPYCKRIDKKKMIAACALSLIQDDSVENREELNEFCNLSTENLDFQAENQGNESTNQREYLNFLISENTRLNGIIAEKDAIISDYIARITALAEREQELTANAISVAKQEQTLHLLAAADDDTKRTWRERLAAFILGKNKK